jgi:hypothetical protein
MARERRIEIIFDNTTLAQIEELERLSGKSALTILQECVNLSSFLYKKQRKGAQLWLLEEDESDHSMREVEQSP